MNSLDASLDAAIEISDLEFSYPNSSPVLKILNFRMKRGEKVFLHGPSGSGKSTFLSLIAGILVATQGKVQVLGRSLTEMSETFRDEFRGKHIGYVFQNFNLIPYLSVKENMELPLKLFSGSTPEMEVRLGEISNRLGIQDLLSRKASELSVGQSQRVAVGRAILGKPELIIADEPTSALDEAHRDRFLDLLFSQVESSKMSLLFVSHDHRLSSHFDRAVSLVQINGVRGEAET